VEWFERECEQQNIEREQQNLACSDEIYEIEWLEIPNLQCKANLSDLTRFCLGFSISGVALRRGDVVVVNADTPYAYQKLLEHTGQVGHCGGGGTCNVSLVLVGAASTNRTFPLQC
jgi:hypothetical protein